MVEPPEPDGQIPIVPITPRNQPHERPPAASPQDALASFADSFKMLAGQLGAAPAAATEEEQERNQRRRKKFQRSGNPEPRRPDASPPEATPVELHVIEDDSPDDELAEEEAAQKSATATALNKSIAWPQTSRHERVAQTSSRPARKPRSMKGPLLVLMACNIGMLVFGYVLGQLFVPQPADATVAPDASLSEKALETADTALRAEKDGDLKTARRLYDDAVQRGFGLPGAEYRLALLAIQRHDLADADTHLIHSTNAGEFVAPCHYLRATWAGALGNYSEAGRQLEAAAHAEPLNAKYYFFQGEALRRQGKPRAAIDCFRQALNRAYSPEEGDLFLFKLGLAEIEAGGSDDFEASLAKHLQQHPVPADWLLLAAAQDLEHAAYPAAATHLQGAEAGMPPAMYSTRVQDYFFQVHGKQPEVATFLDRSVPPPATDAGPSIMDPGSWSAEKGDPGTWPVVGAAAPR